MSTGTGLLLGVLLLLANGFFVGAEFAVMSARRSQIEPRAAEGNVRARTAIWAMEHVSLMLACCQLGITLCSLGLGAVAEPALAHLLEVPMHALHIPADLQHPIAFAIAMTIVVYLHVVVGEMIPKNVALARPDGSVLLLATPLVFIGRLVKPFIVALNAIANVALRLIRVEPKDEVASTFTVEQVQSIVEESRKEGLLDDHGDVLSGALEFSDKLARDVMIPLDNLVSVTDGATPEDVERLVARTGFSRFPVANDEGDLIGYLHLKDILYADDHRHDEPIPHKRIRALDRVDLHDEIEDVLASMQHSGAHLARVLDHGGGVHGVLFLEDVLEELVGEIQDASRRSPSTRSA